MSDRPIIPLYKLYSVSQLKLYEQCPLRYRMYYINRIRSNFQWIESFVGARVHESLEYLYLRIKAQELIPISEVIQFYCRRWEQQWNNNIRITHKENNREWYRRYGEKCLRRYYVQYYPFLEPGTHIVEVEWPFQIELDSERRYRMRGHVDRLTRRDDNSYTVHDYKTSPRVPHRGVLERDLQPGVYQLAVSKLFPEAKQVTVSWHYLVSQQELRPSLSMNQLAYFQQKLVRQIENIEHDQEFAPRPSKACLTCEYRHLCPAQTESKGMAISLQHPEHPTECSMEDTGESL